MSQQIGFDQLVGLWEDGQARLAALTNPERNATERVVDEIAAELRRRVGSRFTTDQLAEEYMRGTDWCFDLAMRVAPGTPEAWDVSVIVGAGFARYMRRASDWGGGRRLYYEE
jgi:hypothetical protein